MIGGLMRRNQVAFRSLATLLFATSLLVMATVPIAAAADSGTVSGTVEVDGKSLAGVEVFLWVGSPRLTCTDAKGEFQFDDVPFDVGLLSATGFGSPERCKNFQFLAPDGAELLTQFYMGHDGEGTMDEFYVTAVDPHFTIQYTPRRAKAGEKVCAGMLATVIGTDGDDELATSPGSNIVYGGAGNDVIKGSPAPFDTLCGGPGRDTIYGYGGSDTLIGGPGADRLFGGGGMDVLFGQGGADVIRGEGGADIIWGFGGADVIRGGSGDDFIRGHGGDDVIRGQAGDDILKGNRGRDQLFGGADYDKAFGGPGKDTCKAEEKSSC